MSVVHNLTRLLEWIYPVCLRKVTEGSLTQLNNTGECFFVKLIPFLCIFWIYFLSHLPDSTPLMVTFVCLNLSFNNLLFFPMQVLPPVLQTNVCCSFMLWPRVKPVRSEGRCTWSSALRQNYVSSISGNCRIIFSPFSPPHSTVVHIFLFLTHLPPSPRELCRLCIKARVITSLQWWGPMLKWSWKV